MNTSDRRPIIEDAERASRIGRLIAVIAAPCPVPTRTPQAQARWDAWLAGAR